VIVSNLSFCAVNHII